MATLLLETIKWNYERNKLEFKPELEIKLLTEELTEFKDNLKIYFDKAENFRTKEPEEITDEETESLLGTVVDLIDAVCDSVFVLFGSKSKSIGHVFPELVNLEKEVEFTKSVLFDILTTELGIEPKSAEELISASYKAVVEANKQKGTKKDENGKVMKPENFEGPEVKIKKYLKAALRENNEKAVNTTNG